MTCDISIDALLTDIGIFACFKKNQETSHRLWVREQIVRNTLLSPERLIPPDFTPWWRSFIVLLLGLLHCYFPLLFLLRYVPLWILSGIWIFFRVLKSETM